MRIFKLCEELNVRNWEYLYDCQNIRFQIIFYVYFLQLFSGGVVDMKQLDNDIVCDFFIWYVGGGSYVLIDEYNNVSFEKKKWYFCYFY